jgi:hypothetical protein
MPFTVIAVANDIYHIITNQQPQQYASSQSSGTLHFRAFEGYRTSSSLSDSIQQLVARRLTGKVSIHCSSNLHVAKGFLFHFALKEAPQPQADAAFGLMVTCHNMISR